MRSLQGRTALLTAIGGLIGSLPLALLAFSRADLSGPAVWLALAASALIGGIVGWVGSQRRVRELAALQQVIDHAADGDLSISADPSMSADINDLSRSLNRLISRFDAAENRNAQEQRWVAAILDGLRDGVMLVDADEQVIEANARSGELIGQVQEIRSGQRLMMLARDYELVAQFREVMRSRESTTRTVQHLRSERSVEITILPVETEGELFGLIVLKDVTELRRLELVRREFVANVSHELKTPLASIRALADTLAAGAVDDPEVSEDFLGRIVYEVDRLTRLVEGLLDLGRLESGRLVLHYQSVQPGVLIAAAADRMQTQIDMANLSVTIDVPESLSPVMLDAERIEQVLINLIQNAVKFTPAGGSIVVRATEGDRTLVVEVIDTGEGIDADELPRVFERFYKSDRARRSSGTGLGLAIAKHIVLAHGGQIHARSKLGHGSTFIVELPMDAHNRCS